MTRVLAEALPRESIKVGNIRIRAGVVTYKLKKTNISTRLGWLRDVALTKLKETFK